MHAARMFSWASNYVKFSFSPLIVSANVDALNVVASRISFSDQLSDLSDGHDASHHLIVTLPDDVRANRVCFAHLQVSSDFNEKI